MNAVLANFDISYDENPNLEIVSDYNFAEKSYNLSEPKINHLFDTNMFYHIENQLFLEENDKRVKLFVNQEFFLQSAIIKLFKTIELENDFLQSEKINQPTINVISNTIKLIELLAFKSIFPERISTSVEEGICLSFKKDFLILYLEIYNNGEIGYIIEDKVKKTIIDNSDIETIDESSKLIEGFFSQHEIS